MISLIQQVLLHLLLSVCGDGAKEVYACCTHPVLSGPAIERIQNSPIKELVVTNSIALSDEKKIDKIMELSVAH